MKIRINNQQDIPITLKEVRKITRYTLRKEGIEETGIEVSILLVDDKGIKKINKEYLGRSSTTDVISFRMWEGPYYKLHPEIVGDVVVNVSLAKKIGRPFKKEFTLYLIHGLLHLLGYVDDTEQHAKTMQERCKEILRQLWI